MDIAAGTGRRVRDRVAWQRRQLWEDGCSSRQVPLAVCLRELAHEEEMADGGMETLIIIEV